MQTTIDDSEEKRHVTQLHRFNTKSTLNLSEYKKSGSTANTLLDIRTFKPITARAQQDNAYYTFVTEKWEKENEIICVDYDDTLSLNGSLILFIGTKFGLIAFDTVYDVNNPTSIQCRPKILTMPLREYTQRYPYTHNNFEDHEYQYLEVDRINKVIVFLIKDELWAARYVWKSEPVQNQTFTEVDIVDIAKVNTVSQFGARAKKIVDFSIQKPDKRNMPGSTKNESMVSTLPICVLAQDRFHFIRIQIFPHSNQSMHSISYITKLPATNIKTMIYSQNYLAVLTVSNKYGIAMCDTKTNEWKFVYFSDQPQKLQWWKDTVLSENPDLYGDFAAIIAGDSNLVAVDWGSKAKDQLLAKQKMFKPLLISMFELFNNIG
jgi:hypothetical protein